jgi:DNA recombination protein RmuC
MVVSRQGKPCRQTDPGNFMNTTLLIIELIGCIGCLALGWFFGSRSMNEWRQRADANEATVKQMTIDLAGMSERVRQADALATDLADIRRDRDALAPRLATAEARAADAERLRGELADMRAARETLATELATLKADAANFDEQKRLLLAAQAELRKEF